MKKNEFFKRLVEAENRIYNLDTPSINCERRKRFALGTSLLAFHTYDAFCTLADSKNYIAAIQQIRMQIDNVMYLFAATIATNQTTFFEHFEANKDLNKLKIRGNALTTTYLLTLMEDKYSDIKIIYKECCKWVHPTSKRLSFVYIVTPLQPNELVSHQGYRDRAYPIRNMQIGHELIDDLYADMYYVIDVLIELMNKLAEIQNNEINSLSD